MTFEDWYNGMEAIDQPQYTNYGGRRIVYSICPMLWDLSDYKVTSTNGTITYLKKM